MNGERFHQQKRIEMKTEQCERSLSYAYKSRDRNKKFIPLGRGGGMD